MRDLSAKNRPWLPAESEQFTRWVEDHRSIGEMSFLLQRDASELEARASELGITLPREFETRFFFKKHLSDQIKSSPPPPA